MKRAFFEREALLRLVTTGFEAGLFEHAIDQLRATGALADLAARVAQD